MESQNTPFWLEIKTEYIDANLDKVISYLSKESQVPGTDPFYEETERLLSERVKELSDSLSSAPIGSEDGSFSKDENLTALRILGAFVLVSEDMSAPPVKEAYFFFLKTLSCLVPSSVVEELTEFAVRSLTKKSIVNPGFSWADLKTVQSEILAHKLINTASLSEETLPDAWFEGRGSVRIKGGFLEMYPKNRTDSLLMVRTASSLPLFDDTVMVQTSVSDRIPQSDEEDFEVMDSFTQDYLRSLSKVTPSRFSALKSYSQGDTMYVRYLGKDYIGNLLVETVDGDHEKISGQIPFRSDVFRQHYSVTDLSSALKEGDMFKAVYKGGAKCTFEIGKTFTEALVNNAVAVGEEVLAVLRSVNSHGLMVWWTDDGYPAYVKHSDDPGTFGIGDAAYLLITGRENNGYVYATISEEATEVLNESESKAFCISQFIDNEYVPAKAPESFSLGSSLMKGLCRLLFRYQRTLSQASERFRALCVCRILSSIVSDAEASDYVSVACDYLLDLVHFAGGHVEKIRQLEPSPSICDEEGIVRRMEIVKILQSYGDDGASDYLSDVIHREGEDPLLVQLAKLIQSSNRIDDVYPAIKTVIKREITRFLAVQTEDNTDFERASGPNLGVENGRTEFKTSFFFAPSNAPEQLQEKNIFRSLCSFLNTPEGGILYLGVNDSGGINGLDGELETLRQKTYYSGIDGYVRYITDRAKIYFDLDVRIHFHIEPAYDDKVIAIRVDPYEHGVVEFEGVPYIRNNSESVKMSQTLRRQIEAKRISSAKDKPSKNIVALSEAIKEKRQVYLNSYASSYGGDMRNRHVEPFAFLGNNAFVWCYDLEDDSCKLFRVSRIGNVQVTSDPWEKEQLHLKGKTDIFHFTGEDEIPVKLELDMMARNLLLEEYPDSGNEISDLGGGKWLLDTKVRNILGIGRFYCGLATHIKILDCPQLEKYAKEYFRESLEKLG